MDFKLYKETDLEFLFLPTQQDGSRLVDFNIEKLEQEYDYDTDEGQLLAAKAMLMKENMDAIQFYVKEEAIVLVDNIKMHNPDYNKK